MKNFPHFFFILLFSSCQILHKKPPIFSTEKNDIIIYANVQTGKGLSNSFNIKTKIILSKDSLLIQAYPIMGLSLGEVIVNNERIYINKKITNTLDSIYTKTLDPTFELKAFINSIVQLQLEKDSVFYNNNYLSSVFTDYKYVPPIFLPSKIMYSEKNTINEEELLKKTIHLDYKSVKYDYRE